MKLEQLKVMQAVVETGSVKGASELLHKTQPAISQALKSLEFQSGAQLFDRSGYRLELTSLGERVYLQSLRVLEETADLSQLLVHFEKGNEEKFNFAIDANTDIAMLKPVFNLLQAQFPETRIIVKTEILSGTIQSVQEGLSDIGIAPAIPVFLEEAGLDYAPLYNSKMINVASPDLVMAMESAKKVSDLRRFHQVVVMDSGNAEGIFNRDFGVQKGQRRWFVSDLSMKKDLMLDGFGWGRLPGHLVAKEIKNGKLAEIQLEDTHLKLEMNFFAFRKHVPAIGPVASTVWEKLKGN